MCIIREGRFCPLYYVLALDSPCWLLPATTSAKSDRILTYLAQTAGKTLEMLTLNSVIDTTCSSDQKRVNVPLNGKLARLAYKHVLM